MLARSLIRLSVRSIYHEAQGTTPVLFSWNNVGDLCRSLYNPVIRRSQTALRYFDPLDIKSKRVPTVCCA